MNIGIDIDNVISNFNEVLLNEFIIHDKELGNDGIGNKDADYITRGMFNWGEDEINKFYHNNIERIAKSLDIIDGAKEYIDKLKADGHFICIITGRDNGEYSDPYNMTKEWLDKFNVYYDKLILTDAYRNDKHGKTEKCIENNIDIMIDDSVNICIDCIENGIPTLLMDTPYNRKLDIPRVHDWKELYEYISNYKHRKGYIISAYGLRYEILTMKNIDIAFKIQKETWPDDPDYNDLYDKANNAKDDNCFFLVYDNENLIGITGVDIVEEYKDTIWLDWFTILPQYRRMGYGTKVLLDTIQYCKSLKKYFTFRVDTTYYESRPALFLYDKIMQSREEYTAEDTETVKYNTLIYSYALKGELELWDNRYLGLNEYYDKCCDNRLNVILDTDTYNECDDQFALSYMLKSQNIFNVEAITVAPYSHKTKNVSVSEGQELSYNEIIKICNLLNFDTNNKVFKGSMDYLVNGYNEENDAVKKIIEIALKKDKTYIMAIGAITNVALAIKKEPKIIDKIEVIWLGGHSLLQKDNFEFNFRQDVEAVKIVFNSKVKLTIIPCKNVASNLTTSVYELNYYLKDKNELCNYLIDRFYNDGYHGIQERRVIWDISVIAYMINKNWFETDKISCPIINEDTSYMRTQDRHEITMATNVDVNEIYRDLFKKLGGI